MSNQYTKLIIDNQEVDLGRSEDIPLNITKSVNNIQGSIQGDYSRASITVPATKKNISILGDNRSFKEFRIEVNGAPYSKFSGLAQIRKGKKFSQGYEGVKQTYEINLISANSSPFTKLGGKTLDEMTDLVVEYNTVPIQAGFLAEPNLRDYVFTFAKFKQWENPTGSGSSLRYQLSLFESTPGLYIRPLLHAAFNSIGWTLDSEWLETDLGTRLFMLVPFPEKMPRAYNDKYLNTEVSMSSSTTFGTDLGNFPFDVIDVAAPSNPTAYDNTLFEYTAPLSGYYSIELKMTFGATAPAPPYVWFVTLEVDGVDVEPRIGFAFSSAATGPQYPSSGQELTARGIVFLDAGQVCNYRFSTSGGVTVETASCIFTGEAIIEQGIDIDFKYLLEGLSVTEFIYGIKTMFNLVFEGNEATRTMIMEPKDGYVVTDRENGTTEYIEGFYTSENKDYTRLLDRSKENTFNFPNIDFRQDYAYELDNDETAEWIEGINDFGIYESRFEMESGGLTSKPNKITVPFFAKTIHILDSLAAYPDTNTYPQFPLIYNGNYVEDPTVTTARTDIKPRILYFAGQRFGGTFDEDEGMIELLEFPGTPAKNPLAFMVNFNDYTGLDPNLGFDNQVVNGVESVGLLQRYYLQDLVRKNRGKTEQGYVRFNSVDEQNFTFRIKATLSSQRYIVQEITGFNPLVDTPSEFTFYLDVFPTSDDVDNIQNSPVQGIITNQSS